MTTKTNVKKEKEILALRTGATVKVYEKIQEKAKGKKGEKGELKERIQIFEGIVLSINHKNENTATITVRKVSNGIGVEKIFPINSPVLEKIEVIKQAKVHKAKLYYLRDYKKKLKEVKK